MKLLLWIAMGALWMWKGSLHWLIWYVPLGMFAPFIMNLYYGKEDKNESE